MVGLNIQQVTDPIYVSRVMTVSDQSDFRLELRKQHVLEILSDRLRCVRTTTVSSALDFRHKVRVPLTKSNRMTGTLVFVKLACLLDNTQLPNIID